MTILVLNLIAIPIFATDNAPPMNKIKESLRYTHISEHIPLALFIFADVVCVVYNLYFAFVEFLYGDR